MHSLAKLTFNAKVFTLVFSLWLLAGGCYIASQLMQSGEVIQFLYPTTVTIFIFLAFSIILKWEVKGYLFGEIGFLYMGLAVAYTLVPAFTFIFGRLQPTDPLSWLMPVPGDLAVHLWRHTLFIIGIATGYLVVRGRRSLHSDTKRISTGGDAFTIAILIVLAAVCIFILIYLSASVDTYWDNYTRYDHLSWGARKLVSTCVRFKLGIYSVLLVFLFLNYRKYKVVIPIVVGVMCLHDLLFSRGSRIETFVILLQVVCLYHYTVKKIALRKIFLICIPAAMFFSIMEVIRAEGLDLNKSLGSDLHAFRFPAEFDSVYLTGFHLYAERAKGALPPTEWPMFFNEFISIFTFGDFDRWNPMVWYTKNYFPDSAVPPFTLGPIADSAIWGGEIDLVFRGLLSGAFFAYIVRWFLRWREKWWAMTIYFYCCATCILTLKYSVFYHLTPIFKTILPVLMIVWLVRFLASPRRRNWLAKDQPQATIGIKQQL